jgi:hypothetical protein
MTDVGSLVREEMERAGAPSYSFEDVDRLRDRRHRRQRIAAGAVGIAVFAAAILLVTSDLTVPDVQPTSNVEAEAEAVARGFVDAYAAFDAQQAMTYLAQDADLGLVETSQQLPLEEALSSMLSLARAVGLERSVSSCVTAPFGSDTSVVCDFVFHALGSDQIGRGPYGGSYVFTVHDGLIIRADVTPNTWTRFDRQMLEPFVDWVRSTYPEDAGVMFVDATLEARMMEARMSPESIRLWEQHTRDYVEAVQRGTA